MGKRYDHKSHGRPCRLSEEQMGMLGRISAKAQRRVAFHGVHGRPNGCLLHQEQVWHQIRRQRGSQTDTSSQWLVPTSIPSLINRFITWCESVFFLR